MSTPRTVHALSMTLLLGLFGPQPAFAHASENASSSSEIHRSISTSTETADAAESLPRLIQWAITHDLAQQQLNLQADALSEQGIASSQWMDPKLKVGVGGLPVDSFSLDEDPMTNLSVGLMQQFGRGDTLALKNQQSQYLAESVRQQTGVRTLAISKAISEQWIELVYLQHVQQKMVQNKKLLNTLVQYLSTNYGVGVNQAQDLIQAELQVHRIDDQLNANQQQQQRRLALLSEWLGDQARTIQATQYPQWAALTAVVNPQVNTRNHNPASQPFVARLAAHPAITVVDAQLQSAQTGIAIAEEAYQPQFSVEVMYAHRQADRMDGSTAPDLVSAYLTLDIPLFTDKRQDKALSAAQYQAGAVRTQRDLLIQQMQAQIQATLADRTYLAERLQRYRDTLQPQARAKTQAVERGYQNTTSSLDEYIKAASEELTIAIEQSRIEADWQQANNTLAYLLNSY